MWKVTLSNVALVEEEYSLHPGVMQAIGAAGELEKELGLLGVDELFITVKRSPVTGELLMVTVEEVDDVC